MLYLTITLMVMFTALMGYIVFSEKMPKERKH